MVIQSSGHEILCVQIKTVVEGLGRDPWIENLELEWIELGG